MRSYNVIAGETGFAGQYTNLRHDARGGSFLLTHQQLGAIALPTNPSNTQTLTLTINGNAITITFVSAIGTTAGNVLIGASATATAANLLSLLNQPQTTTANGVALSTANQQLVSYLSWSLVGTTITPSSNNTSLSATLSSFTASTTATGGSWTAQTMQLYVEPGVVYVNGTRVIWSGGSSPTITAPSSHPRIDLLTIDSTGTLALTTGTENASPSAPTYPSNKIVLCEIYNVVGETAIYDLENQQSGEGYVYHDVRPMLQPSMIWTAFSSDFIPDGDGTRNLGSGSFEWNNIYAKTGIFLNGQSVGGILSQSFTATESISAGAAVAATLYQSTPIGYDTSGIFGRGTASGSITVGSNSNRLLTVVVFASSTSAVSGTYNSVSLTFAQTNYTLGSNPYCVAIGYLVAPSTGSNTLSITGTDVTRVVYSSFYNCAQSSPLDATGYNGLNAASSISATLTLGTDGAVSFGALDIDGGSSPNIGSPAGNIYGANTTTSGGVNDAYAYGNSGVTVQYGANATMTISTSSATSSTTVLRAGILAIKPYNATIAGVQNASSASITAPNTRCTAFVGFANSSVTAGQTVVVILGGIIAGLSAIQSGIQYYLNDTNGTIGSSPGSNTRKVGIGIDNSHLLVTNIW